MKRSDVAVLGVVMVILLPFLLFPQVVSAYESFNAAHAYVAGFIKFAFLATFGESLGLRLRTGVYNRIGFGLLPRALVWGFLGVTIKIAFVIFGEGSPMMLKTMGISFPTANPADVLRQTGFSWTKLLAAFSVGTMLNLFFAPVFMAFHRITDTHIQSTGGTIRGFFTPVPVGQYFREIDWHNFWDFVVKKTIPLFWIPAQTLNFMLPEEYRILVAALYSIILGILLSLASLMEMKRL
ncbi:MAG: Mpv17/PMP22 family protein [Bacteroidota bacterium]